VSLLSLLIISECKLSLQSDLDVPNQVSRISDLSLGNAHDASIINISTAQSNSTIEITINKTIIKSHSVDDEPIITNDNPFPQPTNEEWPKSSGTKNSTNLCETSIQSFETTISDVSSKERNRIKDSNVTIIESVSGMLVAEVLPSTNIGSIGQLSNITNYIQI